MRAVVQRVSHATVSVEGRRVSEIGSGLLVLVSVARGDGDEDLEYLTRKILNLRVFEDSRGRMNASVQDVGGALMVVSQFTLQGDCRRGHRPSFSSAESPPRAQELFDRSIQKLQDSGLEVRTGIFGACMSLKSTNEGPVTVLIDSRRAF